MHAPNGVARTHYVAPPWYCALPITHHSWMACRSMDTTILARAVSQRLRRCVLTLPVRPPDTGLASEACDMAGVGMRRSRSREEAWRATSSNPPSTTGLQDRPGRGT